MTVAKLGSVVALAVLFGLAAPRSAFVEAQDSTYSPTPGYDKVKAAMSRLKREGDKLSEGSRTRMLSRGQECLDLEQRDYEGRFPFAQQIKANDRLRRPIPADLQARIDAENGREATLYAVFVRDVDAAFARAKPAANLPAVRPSAHTQVRLATIGKADGSTVDNEKFPRTAGVAGSLDLNVLGSAVRKIQTDWDATPVVGSEAVDPQIATHKTQEWIFKSKEYGTAKVTIKGDEEEAAGTATGWEITTKDGRTMKLTFSVQFSGNRVLLHTFAENILPQP